MLSRGLKPILPKKDAEMDLIGTAIPDDEFHEEPLLEEAQVPGEVPNAQCGKIGSHANS